MAIAHNSYVSQAMKSGIGIASVMKSNKANDSYVSQAMKSGIGIASVMKSSKANGWTSNILLMAELRKRVLTFRGVIHLPPANGSVPINELLVGLIIDLQEVYPKVVNCSMVSETAEKPLNQVLNQLYDVLKSVGDSWYENDAKKMNLAEDSSSISMENVTLEQLSQKVLGKIDELIDMRREMSDASEKTQKPDESRIEALTIMDMPSEPNSRKRTNTSPLTSPKSVEQSSSSGNSPWLFRLEATKKLKPIEMKYLPSKLVSPPFPHQDRSFIKTECQVFDPRKARNDPSGSQAEMTYKEPKACQDSNFSTRTSGSDSSMLSKAKETETSQLKHLTTEPSSPSNLPSNGPATLPSLGLPSCKDDNKSVEVSAESSVPSLPCKLGSICTEVTASESILKCDANESPSIQKRPPPPPPPLPLSSKVSIPTGVTGSESSLENYTSRTLPIQKRPPPPPPPLPLSSKASIPIGVTGSESSLENYTSRSLPIQKRPPPPPPPLPPRNLSSKEATSPPPPPPGSVTKGSMPPPPPPPGMGKVLRPRNNSRLKRSILMVYVYQVLKKKEQGSAAKSKSIQGKKSQIGKSAVAKQGMAEAIEEITRKSAYFQQIEEDARKYAAMVLEIKAALNAFETKDMEELLKFLSYVEQHLEKLSDETQVLARFEDFPVKKLEALRGAGALYSKLKEMSKKLKEWKIAPPTGQLLDKIETYFNKIKREIEALELTKDEESKRFKSNNVHFDFNVLEQVKESMVDVSSSCMELALKEWREAKASKGENGGRTKIKGKATASGMVLWRTFQFAYRVYSFAGGQDDRADLLTRELARAMEIDPSPK